MPDNRDLTAEELKALVVEAGMGIRDLLPKLTDTERRTFVQLANTDDAVIEAMGGVMGAPLAPPGLANAGRTLLSKVPGLKSLAGTGESLSAATRTAVRSAPRAPLPAATGAPSNLRRVDTSATPSIDGGGGVSVEGPGVLGGLLAALGLGTYATPLQKRRPQ